MIVRGKQPWFAKWSLLAVWGLSTVSGCGTGSEIGTVAGVVTLDGQPLPHATVEFVPAEGFSERSSYDGSTDESGRYELFYSADRKGAPPGDYTVHISLPSSDDDTTIRPARLPAAYNVRSELTATVKPGENRFDWALNGWANTFR